MQTSWREASIVISTSYDPWYNLAVEEALLRESARAESETVLYLWQNQNTVVIGRNQNAWKECRWELLHAEGGKLARRLSGGGAVYHDLGNLNFTFVTSRKGYDLKKQLQVILEAVGSLGIAAEFSGRNDILAGGRKFSGNAFYKDTHRAYHHGTILVAVDFAKLNRYLQVSREKMAAKGIDSVRSRVVNLSELRPGLTVDDVREALKTAFRRIYSAAGEEAVIEGWNESVRDLYEKYASWEWRFGKTPPFDLTLQRRFAWGEIELGLTLKGGFIQDARVFSDAMEPQLIEAIAPKLRSLPLDKAAMTAAVGDLGETPEEKGIIREIQEWLSSVDL
ncbi:MAG TPA: lipoate--protein ligase [Firmicutes bacterium]|nr:lipoate--protein ligase [Bacillota bacterium]